MQEEDTTCTTLFFRAVLGLWASQHRSSVAHTHPPLLHHFRVWHRVVSSELAPRPPNKLVSMNYNARQSDTSKKNNRPLMNDGRTVSPNTATLLQDARLISERVRDVSNPVSARQHECDVQQHNLPSATSQALRSWEWWAFFTSLSARIFSKARVRNMFFVFLPSNMSHRNLGRGVPGPERGGGLQPPRMEMYSFTNVSRWTP